VAREKQLTAGAKPSKSVNWSGCNINSMAGHLTKPALIAQNSLPAYFPGLSTVFRGP
jgi:hypothetical protein